jgi:glycosyltransferase involved in cell wall biosynthesis
MPASRPSAYFDEALASALAQSYDHLEVIITDDSGGSLRAAAASSNDPRVRYTANPYQLGLAGNHSKAVDQSRGRYVAFLHDDDVWHPRHIQHAVHILETHDDVGYVLSGADEIAADGTFRRRRPTSLAPGDQADPLAHILTEHFLLAVPSVGVWRRAALDATPRPWPDLITGDLAAFIDPILAGWRVHYTGDALVRYRVHEGQIGSQRQFAHRDGLVKVWDSYRFANAHHEELRRRVLARWLLARAGSHLKAGRQRAARHDVVAAFREAPMAGLLRSIVLIGISFTPHSKTLVALWRRAQRMQWRRIALPSAYTMRTRLRAIGSRS